MEIKSEFKIKTNLINTIINSVDDCFFLAAEFGVELFEYQNLANIYVKIISKLKRL